MLVKDVIDFLDSYAPLKYSEDFDNTGLIVGDINAKPVSYTHLRAHET